MNLNKIFTSCLTIIILIVSSIALSSKIKIDNDTNDWPMWRNDACHSGASLNDLPSELFLQWKREFNSPEPAFPKEEIRLNFDASYEPVAVDRTLYIPSMVTGSITALNTRTGKEKWKFYADGPVRFAPIAWDEKVYFGSDDGFLYCLNATNGQLKWKFWAPPEELKSYKLIGNNRLISRWAIRGGPVLKDGVIYIGSGLWPSEGVYVCAINAKSGELIWRNNDLAIVENGLVDHGARRDIGLAPLGYLTVAGDKLIVPAGRALPAIFNIYTGKMEPYSSGWGGRGGLSKGSWWVCATDDYFFTNGELYGLSEHEPETELKEFMTANEFAKATNLSIEEVVDFMHSGRLSVVKKNNQELIRVKPERSYLTNNQSQDYESEKYVVKNYPRLQISNGNKYLQAEFRKPIVSQNIFFYSLPVVHDSLGVRFPGQINGARYINIKPDDFDYNGIEAYDLNSEKDWVLTATQNSPDDYVSLYQTMQYKKLWRLNNNLNVQIKAGNRLFGGAPGLVAAIELGDNPEIVWQNKIDGIPSSMLAADNRLFVVTREGALYCFGPKEMKNSDNKHEDIRNEPVFSDMSINTEEILSSITSEKGYCFMLGLSDSKIIQNIYNETKLNIIVLEADSQKVQNGRKKFDRQGIYGKRIQIVPGDLESLNIAPYLANLVICVNPEINEFEEGIKPVNQLISLLRPYNGIAYLSLSNQQYEKFKGLIEQQDIKEISITKTDEFVVIKREGHPIGSAPWTHEEGSAANTSSNMDVSIKPPMGVTWFGGAVDDSIFSKLKLDYTHSRPPVPLVCDGRMYFIIYDEIHALDIYNGFPIWKTSLPHSFKTKSRLQEHFTGRRNTANNYIATTDIIYIFLESSCIKLNSKTGAQIGEITTPKSLKEDFGKNSLIWYEARIWEDNLVINIGNYLVCMNRYSGEMRWKVQTPKDRFNFAIGNNKVFAIDYWMPNFRDRIIEKEKKIKAFDILTGNLIWDISALVPRETNEIVRYRTHPIDPYLSYSEKKGVVLLSNAYNVMGAFTGEGGKPLWRTENIRIPRGFPPVVLSDMFITQSGEAYDLISGLKSEEELWNNLRGCNAPIGNQESVFVRDGVPGVYRIDSGYQSLFMSSRSGCTNNLVPGGGVMTVLNFAVGCACNYPVFTSFGATHIPEMALWNQTKMVEF